MHLNRAVGFERVGPKFDETLVVAGARVDDALAENGAHRAANVLVAVDVEKGINGRIHVAHPPDHQSHVARNFSNKRNKLDNKYIHVSTSITLSE